MEVVLKITAGYSGTQIALHWLLAVLIVVAWFTGGGGRAAIDTVEKGGSPGFVLHIALGLSILALVAVRVLVRLGRGAPAAPGAPGSLLARAGDWGHGLIYLLMIAVPLGGFATYYFGFGLGDIHALAANILMLVVLGHALMALYHQYVLKDGVLRRMMKAEQGPTRRP